MVNISQGRVEVKPQLGPLLLRFVLRNNEPRVMVSPNTTVVTIMDNTSKMGQEGLCCERGGGGGWCGGGHGGGGVEEMIRNTHFNTFHRIMFPYVNLLCSIK